MSARAFDETLVCASTLANLGAGKDAMIVAEVERMKAHELRTGGAYKVESMHINGRVPYQTVIPTEG